MTKEQEMIEMSNVVKVHLKKWTNNLYFYPNIPDKVLTRLIKHCDNVINPNNVIAIADSSLFNNASEGLVFMMEGFYIMEMFSKPYYINYEDIEQIEVVPDKKGDKESLYATISIVLSSGYTYTYTDVSFYKQSTATAIQRMKDKFFEYGDIIVLFTTGKVTKDRKINLTEKQKTKCHAIIHTAAGLSGGVGTGLAQLPLVDTAFITPFQVTMIISLGAVFDINVTESVAKSIIAGAGASFLGRGAVQLLVGWIPGLGNAINTATAAGLTEAIGWMAVAHFYNMQLRDKQKYRVENMKEGYAAASSEYEAKLRKQGQLFLSQKVIFESQIAEFNEVIAGYECIIAELQSRSTDQSSKIKELEAELNKLRLLKAN